jgi:hypothetical protein
MEKNGRERLLIEVDCTSSASTVPEPRRIHAGYAVYDVAEIVDRWHEGPRRAGAPSRRYFKVRSRGGSVFLILYDEGVTAWFLVKSFGPEIPIAT